MAIAYDTSGTFFTYSSSTSNISVTVANVSNRYLFVSSESGISAVSFDGQSLTLLTTLTPTATGGASPAPIIKIWGLANPSTGTKTLSVTGTAQEYNWGGSYVIYNGVSSTQPAAYNTSAPTYSPGNQYSSSLSTSVVTTVSSSWVVNFFASESNSATINGSVGSKRTDGGSGLFGPRRYTIFDSNSAINPTATYDFTGTFSSGSYGVSAVAYEVQPYISFTLSGPSSGNVNSASTNFTVTPDAAINGTITITPSGAAASGIDPIILTFSNSATPQTFTITPSVAGVITLTPTNGLGLPNPGAITYTANAVVPGAPVIGTAVPGNTQASVAFSAPSNNGGATITNYTATSSPGSITGSGASSPVTVTGLTNGVAYTFTVTATNSAGTGAASSASNSVTPYVAATSFTFTGPTSGNVRSASTNFTVTPNAVYFGTITITPSGAGSAGLSPTILTFNGSSAAQTFTITPNDSGLITLTPTNSNSLSNPADLSYTANAVVPLAPTIGSVVPQIEQIAVGVSAPSNDGGADITAYTIYCSNGQTKTLTSPGEAVFTELTPGTSYTFYANCTNSVGVSADSATTDAVTPLDQSARIYNNAPKFNITPDVGNVLSF